VRHGLLRLRGGKGIPKRHRTERGKSSPGKAKLEKKKEAEKAESMPSNVAGEERAEPFQRGLPHRKGRHRAGGRSKKK